MKIINKENRAYIAYDTVIMPEQVIEVTDKKVLDILLKQPGIEEYIDKKEAKQIEEENKKLKAELEKVKKSTKTTSNKKKVTK